MPGGAALTGVGLGLRWSFLDDVLSSVRAESPPIPVDFFEVSPENYMRRGGYFPSALDVVRSAFPLLTHGLTLSVGAVDPFDDGYLGALKGFVERVDSPFHSDHLCFGGAAGMLVHDLLPLPFIEEAIHHVAARVREVRERLGVPIALENISYYLHPGAADLAEGTFIRAVLEESDATMLLDVNNVFVNAQNFGFDAWELIDGLPLERVVAIHVAGHEHRPEHGRIIDTHGAETCDPVLDLLERTVARTGPVPVVLERDHHVPELPVLLDELARVRAAYERGLAARPS